MQKFKAALLDVAEGNHVRCLDKRVWSYSTCSDGTWWSFRFTWALIWVVGVN